jgi:hypothetical protein
MFATRARVCCYNEVHRVCIFTTVGGDAGDYRTRCDQRNRRADDRNPCF